MPYRDPNKKRAHDHRYYAAHRRRRRREALARYHTTKDLSRRRDLYRLKRLNRLPSLGALRRNIARITKALAILNSVPAGPSRRPISTEDSRAALRTPAGLSSSAASTRSTAGTGRGLSSTGSGP